MNLYCIKIGLKHTDPLYICVMSGTNLVHLFIAVFHHILSTKPVWFLITVHTSQTACNQNNGIIFSSLPSFISYSCHINTWLNRWKPGFIALRRFLLLNKFTAGGLWTITKSSSYMTWIWRKDRRRPAGQVIENACLSVAFSCPLNNRICRILMKLG